jgi:DNA-binding NtrC family response regulator
VLGDSDLIVQEFGKPTRSQISMTAVQTSGSSDVRTLSKSDSAATIMVETRSLDTSDSDEEGVSVDHAASILEKVDAARREGETQAILSALSTSLWNRKEAAAFLKIDYKALLYKMKKLGIGEKSSKISAYEV